MPLTNHDINFLTMVTQLLGTPTRKPIRIAWLTACFKGLRSVHDKFLAFTNAKLEEVKYNGQAFVMEKMLHAVFGPGIYVVTNIGSLDGLTIGAGIDWSGSIGEGTDYGGAIGESYTVAAFSFTVHVPIAIVFVQSEMESWIRKYKLFGTTFNIVIDP